MANQFFPNVGKTYYKHVMPVVISTQFKVAAADAAGYGVTGVGGPGIAAVYMFTSQTPPAASPNPAAGFIMIKLTDNYVGLLGLTSQITSPPSGSNVNIDLSDAALTAGQLYVITTVGTSTLADWQTVGLPKGLTPTIGQAFIAIATGAGTGSGKVQVPKTSGAGGIVQIQAVGLPDTEIGPWSNPMGAGVVGSYLFLQCLAATNSSTTTLIPTAPTDGSIISLQLLLSNSTAKSGAAGQ